MTFIYLCDIVYKDLFERTCSDGIVLNLYKIKLKTITRILAIAALLIVIGALIAQVAGCLSGLSEAQWQGMLDNIYGHEVLGWITIVLSAYGAVLFGRAVNWRKNQHTW